MSDKEDQGSSQSPPVLVSSDQPGAAPSGAWQPIESAPKDRPILLFAYQRAHEMLACDVPLILTGYWDAIDGSWCGTSSTWTGPFYDATHWMPFPAPPEGPTQ